MINLIEYRHLTVVCTDQEKIFSQQKYQEKILGKGQKVKIDSLKKSV